MDDMSSTLVLHLKSVYHMDSKAAKYFHIHLEAEPKVKQFFVRVDLKELVLRATNGHEINIVLPVGMGKFHSPADEEAVKIADFIDLSLVRCHGHSHPTGCRNGRP